MKNSLWIVFLIILGLSFSRQSFAIESAMSEEKAHTIAYAFFREKLGSSGGVANGIDRGKRWEFQPYIGVTAKPMFKKISVNKKDGKVYFSNSIKNILKVLFP
jgi:hypothetical protein